MEVLSVGSPRGSFFSQIKSAAQGIDKRIYLLAGLVFVGVATVVYFKSGSSNTKKVGKKNGGILQLKAQLDVDGVPLTAEMIKNTKQPDLNGKGCQDQMMKQLIFTTSCVYENEICDNFFSELVHQRQSLTVSSQ